MIRKLHIRLTALCTAITGLILAVLTLICLFISESDIRHQESASFQTNLNTLYQNLEVQTSLSHNWIRQMEYHYQFSIRIFDQGTPLFYQELEQKKDLDALTEQVIEIARDEYDLDLKNTAKPSILSQQKEFIIYDNNKTAYDASAAMLSCSGGTLGVVVLHPLTRMTSRIFHQRILFLFADAGAIFVLGIFFWYFTAKMIRPLQENRQKQIQFVASASHELRSPLTVILSNIAAVQRGILPGDGQFLTAIDSEGKRMSRLINDMLQLASADNHTWSLYPTETELDTLLLQTWENFESLAAARKIHWEIQLPETSIPPLICDGDRIRQLLSILIDNAFCYTPTEGRVCLSLEYTGNSGTDTPHSIPPFRQTGCLHSLLSRKCRLFYAFESKDCAYHIRVIDNGPGIPDEQKQAVFERFHRLDSSRRDKAHFGLGLCIAQEIVHLHHGEISVTDTPGGGATFTVTLPSL